MTDHTETYRKLLNRLDINRASVYASDLISQRYYRVELWWQLQVMGVVMVVTYDIGEQVLRIDSVKLSASGYTLTVPSARELVTEEFVALLKEQVHKKVTQQIFIVEEGLKLEDLMAYVISMELSYYE